MLGTSRNLKNIKPRALLRSVVRKLGGGKSDALDLSGFHDYPQAALTERAFLNVGAGKFSHPYFTNVDFASEWYRAQQPPGFVHYDLLELGPLPFDSASIQAVYTSHVVEHVTNEAVANLARESFRVLVPGGMFRITCPDAALLLRSIRLNRRSYWHWRDRWFTGPGSTATALSQVELEDFIVREIATERCRYTKDPGAIITPEQVRERLARLGDTDFLNSLTEGLKFDPIRPGNHINWWTEEKLIGVLRNAGFSSIHTSRRGQSLCPAFRDVKLFDTTQPANSLYVEAIKT